MVDRTSEQRRAILQSPLLTAATTRGVLVFLASIQDALANAMPPLPTFPSWFDDTLQSVASRATAYASTIVADQPEPGALL